MEYEEYNYGKADINAFYPHTYDEIADAAEGIDEDDIPDLDIEGVKGEEDLCDFINQEYTITENQ